MKDKTLTECYEQCIRDLKHQESEVKKLKDLNRKLTNEQIKTPNVIFGCLTNGEVYVEVGGEQFTPAESFYKTAAIQSSILAHQVRDLEYELSEKGLVHELKEVKEQNQKLKEELAEVKTKANAQRYKLAGLLDVISESLYE